MRLRSCLATWVVPCLALLPAALAHGAGFAGRVVDEQGEPIPGAMVTARSRICSCQRRWDASVDRKTMPEA